MRIVSLVPSWTETLIRWGAPVVGRTRFCIHPEEAVSSLPSIGGTKKQDWQLIADLKPDIIIADKEENAQDILGRSTAHYHITHVEKVQDMPRELQSFLNLFTQKFPDTDLQAKIKQDIERWEKILLQPPQFTGWQSFPGVVKWLKKPEVPIQEMRYVIWKKPWMSVSRQTFIGSMFELMGLGKFLRESSEKYPSFTAESFCPQTLMLFSTEPYPFAREVESLQELESPSALIDGEGFSWFGSRSLDFLEQL